MPLPILKLVLSFVLIKSTINLYVPFLFSLSRSIVQIIINGVNKLLSKILILTTDSPYAIDVQVSRTYGPVSVYGPGTENGALPFDGQFWVDARKAGTGELYVSVMGPKGILSEILIM